MSFISSPAAASGLTLLQSVTAVASATVDLETGISGTYDDYLVVFDDMYSSFNGDYLDVRLKIGGSYQSTNEYAYRFIYSTNTAGFPTPITDRQDASSRIVLGIDISNNSARKGQGQLWFSNPTSTTARKSVNFQCTWPGLAAGNGQNIFSGGGSFWGSTGALTGIRFLLDSGGTFTTGNFRLYGLART